MVSDLNNLFSHDRQDMRSGVQGDLKQPGAQSSLHSSHLETPGLTPDAPQDISTEHIDISPGFRVSIQDADSAIRLYRTAYMPYFPFVPLPVTMTASELHDSAPFLARTILQMTVPAPASVQKEAQRFFRQQFAQHVVVDQERRLELLQALLVFVAWYALPSPVYQLDFVLTIPLIGEIFISTLNHKQQIYYN